jgi:hypothetical protein
MSESGPTRQNLFVESNLSSSGLQQMLLFNWHIQPTFLARLKPVHKSLSIMFWLGRGERVSVAGQVVMAS